MGRFDTLNAETKDLVECLLPNLAASFGITNCADIIPEDIRMRTWDCERRDHIKDQTENDPRNWGVQFLKDLKAIARIKGGDLALFQADLREKVAQHEPKHPWARLADIKELKDEYEHPNRKQEVVEESSGTSSTDSYLEELVEPDLPKGMKRGRRNHEVYEARVQESHKRRKYGRLRRSEEGGFLRKENSNSRNRYSVDRATPSSSRRSIHRPRRTVESEGEESSDSRGKCMPHPTPSFSMSPGPIRAPSAIVEAFNASSEPLHVQKMAAELELAEAELKAARVKFAYVQAKEQAEAETK
ncbi:hypothetical protein EK21DRAFT_43156, partial [Setomelanomma holmii]